MKEPYKLFGNIKKARVTSGLSQKDLADRLGVSDKTVSAYETGRAIPPTPTLTKIAEITKKTLSELLGIKDGRNGDEIANRLKKIEEHLKQNSSEISTQRIKIDAFVGVVLLDEQNRIYLIREQDKYRISLGRWNLPGGSVDNSESLVDSAKRETKEETGYDAEISSLIGCYKCKKGNNSWIYTVFKGIIKGKVNGKTDPGVKEGKWFSKDEFMKLDPSRIVHPDMKLVYEIAVGNKGLGVESVKYIDYDKE